MLTVTHLCYIATVVTIGILLGVVIRAKAYAGLKSMWPPTVGRGLFPERLAGGPVSADATSTLKALEVGRDGHAFYFLLFRSNRYHTTLCVEPPTATTSGMPSPLISPPRKSWAATSRSMTILFHF